MAHQTWLKGHSLHSTKISLGPVSSVNSPLPSSRSSNHVRRGSVELREESSIVGGSSAPSSHPAYPAGRRSQEAARPAPPRGARSRAGHLSSRSGRSSRRQQLSAPALLPAAFAAETRQGGAAGSLWRHGLRADSKAFIYFTESSDSKEQLQDRLLFHRLAEH